MTKWIAIVLVFIAVPIIALSPALNFTVREKITFDHDNSELLQRMDRADGLQAISDLLSRDSHALETFDCGGMTPLHYAVTLGREDLIPLFVHHGVAIEAPVEPEWSNGGWTALQVAARSNQLDCFKVLIELGANAGIIDKKGKDLRGIATAYDSKDILEYLSRTLPKPVSQPQ